jgi:hypothetical protein
MSEQTFMRFELEVVVGGFPEDAGEELVEAIMDSVPKQIKFMFGHDLVSTTIKETTE